MASPHKTAAACLPAIFLQIAGLFLFIFGFFPVKPSLTSFSGIESFEATCSADLVHVPTSGNVDYLKEKFRMDLQYARLVIMVIDGLPAEFLLGKDGTLPPTEMVEAMHFTQSLLTARKAIGYHARAAPPTVTMPRLKAMTSGSIAGYLDVAFNFNTQAMIGDSLIGQLERLGSKMVMYGDETWLRLFPDTFIRHDGVSSFYVKDTIQVDKNVTRHLDAELSNLDWDVLILHYLGLDHVGHLGGRSSPLMLSKLQEMDDVIERLYTALIGNNSTLTENDTLLLLVSDHGMTYGGNHGGASPDETDSLALFVRRREFLPFVHSQNQLQVDIVPTLALLLGLPIPANNVGSLLPELFDTFTEKEKLWALEVNAWQLMRLLKVRCPRSSCIASICSAQVTPDSTHEKKEDTDICKLCHLFKTAQQLHNVWRAFPCERNSSCSSCEKVVEAYLIFLRTASNWLARGTTEKNKLLVYSGGFFMLVSTAIFLKMSFWMNKEMYGERDLQTAKPENWFAFVGVCGHALSLGSSSLVEEEQFTIYFLVVTLWFFFLRRTWQESNLFDEQASSATIADTWSLLPNISTSDMGNRCCGKSRKVQFVAICVVLITGRIIRSWHRSGVNWAHLPDIAKSLEKVDPVVLNGFRLLSLLFVTLICCWLVIERTPQNLMQALAACSMCSAGFFILFYVMRTNSGVGYADELCIKLAQIVYTFLGLTTISAILFAPWLRSLATKVLTEDVSHKICSMKLQGSLNFIGKVVVSCWCLLQLLLQQPVNSLPITILLLQFIACLIFFKVSGATHSLWLKVLTLYWMGAACHFGMGNTNTLATVDVAGAYIGLSQHSIFFTGLLAFIITYAAPLLYMMGILIIVSFINIDGNVKNASTPKRCWFLEAIAYPSIVLLVLSSISLTVFTFIMFYMQGHLFIWSVFSPKFMYIFFTILTTYVGIIGNAFISSYTFLVVGERGKWAYLD